MATSQSRDGRRFDEEFKREVAALACRPGARQEQVARDLGVSPYSVSRWKKLYGGGEPALGTVAPASAPGVSVQELERRNVRLGAKARELFEASGCTYGSPRLAVALRRAGEPCGRHRVARLMGRAGLRARQKRRFRPRSTDSRHLCPIHG